MNIEYFEYYDLYSVTSTMSNDTVITFTVHFHRVYPWILLPFGFLGSLLTILIFTRKKFQKFGCSILFVAESFMDLILITISCTRLIIRYTFQSRFLQRSIYICRVYKFLTSYLSHCAVWILCVISLERAAVTKSYVWKKNVFSRKHSICTLIFVYLVLFLLDSHYLLFFGSTKSEEAIHSPNETQMLYLIMCSSNLKRPVKAKYEYFLIYYFSWMDFILNSLIPFLIILTANTSVMYSVCQSHILMKQLGLRQTRSARDTQLAYILFVSTFLFLLLTFPLRVFAAIEPYLQYPKKYLIFLDGLMRFLLYLDHGCGFYFYTFTGELFRRELKKFLCECLSKISRRRFNWSYVDSRYHSEISYSNSAPYGSYMYHPSQHANIPLRDSISSHTGSGVNGLAIKTSLRSLQSQKKRNSLFHHQCVYARPPVTRALSTPSSHSRLNPLTGKTSSLALETKPALVKRHSSSCFESQYKPLPALITNCELERRSDIL